MWKSKFFSKKDIWKVTNYVRTLKILAIPTFQRIAKLIMADFLEKDCNYMLVKVGKVSCVNSVHIRSFYGPYFAAFGPEKLRIWTLFTQQYATSWKIWKPIDIDHEMKVDGSSQNYFSVLLINVHSFAN